MILLECHESLAMLVGKVSFESEEFRMHILTFLPARLGGGLVTCSYPQQLLLQGVTERRPEWNEME